MELIHSIWEPAGDESHPTIIALHGWGANALDLQGLAPYLADGKFMTICPQGPIEVPIGALKGYGWFPISMGAPPTMEEIEAGVAHCERFIDDAFERYPIDRRKTVILGFSQGGVMAFRIAFRKPERFAAVVALSTWLPKELLPTLDADKLAQIQIFMGHGRADDMIEVARARQSLELLRDLKVPVAYREYDCGHEITADELQDITKFLTDKVLSPVIQLG